jgi:hypothetical protein
MLRTSCPTAKWWCCRVAVGSINREPHQLLIVRKLTAVYAYCAPSREWMSYDNSELRSERT